MSPILKGLKLSLEQLLLVSSFLFHFVIFLLIVLFQGFPFDVSILIFFLFHLCFKYVYLFVNIRDCLVDSNLIEIFVSVF